MIHISRSGKVIGKHTPIDVAAKIAAGEILPTDYWWTAGMTEWVQVLKQKPPAADTPKQSAPKWGKKDWMSRPPADPAAPASPPASEKQVELIKTFGITPPSDLTKADASRWIDNLIGNELAEDARNKKLIESELKRADKGFGCGGHRTPSGQYRNEMTGYAEAAEAARLEMQENLDEAKNFMGLRVEFWEAILKTGNPDAENGDEDAIEVFILESAEELADRNLLGRLTRLASAVGKIPTRSQIAEAVKLADAASATWDDDKPELFFEKLQISLKK